MSRGPGAAQRYILHTLREEGECQVVELAWGWTDGGDAARQMRRAVRSLESRGLVSTRKAGAWHSLEDRPLPGLAVYVDLTESGRAYLDDWDLRNPV